ncbi:MAG: hypothetical protein GY752_11215 [bacterium]|nr:hypothetical protein [bacterium]MCP4798738.1 hypothetical protein [bacterium]
MAQFAVSYIGYDEPTLPALGKLLLEKDLTKTLVLLPSVRGCASLRQHLLNLSDKKAILLPEVTTPALLVRTLAERLETVQQPEFPGHLRELVLAHELLKLEWANESKSSIPGIATELISLFDEMRTADRKIEDINGDGELFARDLSRVQDAWGLYRNKITYDPVDLALDVIDQVCESEKLLPVNRIVVAGMNDIKPVHLRLLTHLASQVDEALIVADQLTDNDTIGRLLSAGYSKTSRFHPQFPVINCVSKITGNDPVEIAMVKQSDDELLEDLLNMCGDSESESRFVAEQVIKSLQENGADQSIVVATADSSLAKRIVHQLEAAGITVDDTGGTPLPSTKEGLLIWALLRMAVTNMQSGELLELLTHPDVKFKSADVLKFEKELMRGYLEANGPDGFKKRIKEGSSLKELLSEIIEIFKRLDTKGKKSWAEHVAGLRKAWGIATANSNELEGESKVSALIGIIDLLDSLVEQSDQLPKVSLSEFCVELGRLLSGIDARPHRAEHLPVQVTGLVEARIEYADLLILAGMDADTFPGKQNRPILLGNSWRMSSGLQTWEDRLGLEADLFMRILHGGEKVIITWTAEKAGRPTLPSPFISRLTTTLKKDIEFADGAPVYRELLPDLDAIRNEQTSFQNEGIEIPVTGSPRKASHLSNSSISKYLGCPFHYLIEKGFGIGQEDEMDTKIGGKEYGEITHSVMNTAFTYSDLPKLLEDGDIAGAEAALCKVADKEFSKRGDLSQSRMWEASFLQFVPEIIKLEIKNLDLHKPSKHEAPFEFTLGDLRDLGVTVQSKIEEIVIKGRIDRIDINLENEKTYHVYDYKSGQTPIMKDVIGYKDLQLHIYALAMTLGKVSGVSGNVISGGYYKLGKDEVMIKPEVKLTPDILKEAAETIVDVALKSRNYDESFRLLNKDDWEKSGDPKPCTYCHLKTTCRIDEVR